MEEATEKKSEVKTEFFNILQILAIISLAAGLFMALKVLTDYHKTSWLPRSMPRPVYSPAPSGGRWP